MAHYTKFIGLDVHKNSIAVAIADSRSSEVRFYGNIPNTLDGIVKLAKQFRRWSETLLVSTKPGPVAIPCIESSRKQDTNAALWLPP